MPKFGEFVPHSLLSVLRFGVLPLDHRQDSFGDIHGMVGYPFNIVERNHQQAKGDHVIGMATHEIMDLTPYLEEEPIHDAFIR